MSAIASNVQMSPSPFERGFSRFGLSLIFRDAFQPIRDRAAAMTLTLLADVFAHPGSVPRPETDDGRS